MANALLTDANALGYVTELLSGDFQAPFGRSSHHQVWSEAMVVSPVLTGLFGLERSRDATGASTITIAPQVPANWSTFALRHVRVGNGQIDLTCTRRAGEWTYTIRSRGDLASAKIALGVAVPADGAVLGVRANGRRLVLEEPRVSGDVRRALVHITPTMPETSVVFSIRDGSDVYRAIESVPAGAASRGLRILRSRAGSDGLALRLEAPGGTRHIVRLRSRRGLGALPVGVRRLAAEGADPTLEIAFEGNPDAYVRRDVLLPLR